MNLPSLKGLFTSGTKRKGFRVINLRGQWLKEREAVGEKRRSEKKAGFVSARISEHR